MTMHVPLILLKESHRSTMNPSLPFFFKERCGGVKPRPMIQAQEHRFIKSPPEKEESLRPVVGNGGARKCPRRLVREEHPPRI